MTRIATSIRQTVRNSNSFRAVVLSVSGNTATVRVSGVGARYSNLEVIGGPVVVGEWVSVDFATDIPKIIAPTKTATKINKQVAMSRAQLGSSSSASGVTGSGGTASSGDVIIFGSDGAIKETYGSDLATAILGSVEGDSIFIPNGTYDAGSATIPEGVCIFGISRYGSHITSTGMILSDRCSMDTLTVEGPVNASGVVALEGCDFTSDESCLIPASGASISVKECYFKGDKGLDASSAGDAQLTNCYFDCDSMDIGSNGGFASSIAECSYTLFEGNLIILAGDRGAYDTTNNANLHAKDIAEGSYTYHLPPPGSMGEVVISDGSKWISDELVLPGLTTHAIGHGSDGSDELIHIGDTEPTVTFAGKLWCDTGA
jgi:hypothetical protein